MGRDQDLAGRAKQLSEALKEFHRALIRSEIGDDPLLANPYTMLFALIGDPRFAWMSDLSGLITRIDHAVAEGEINTPGMFAPMLDEASALLAENGDPQFRLRHLAALQKEPEVGLATGTLRRAIAAAR